MPSDKPTNSSQVNSAVSGPGPLHEHTPHHVSEFGEVENLVHIDSPSRPSADDQLPAPPIARRDKIALQERVTRLRRKCFHERHIHQYWQGETLYRTEGNRSIGSDELFLDLVIVGGIAAIGHELRVTFEGWREVEKFWLLFGAIYTSWRTIVFFWNLWGVSSDIPDKFGIYIVFTALTFISLGAHGAFKYDNIRPYVGVSAFVATAFPSICNLFLGIREPLIKTKNGRPGQLTIASIMQILSALPYFAAAFVRDDRTTRILYWVAMVLGTGTLFLSGPMYRVLVPDEFSGARIAVSIELLVEKYDVLTMIVLGESVLGMLFEGAELVTQTKARLGYLFGAAAMGTSMLYSLQTLYNNVDAPIAKGGKHAIRYKKLHGLAWSIVHIPYHASLILFATGLGISLRDIAVPPSKEEVEEHVSRVAGAVLSTAARAGEGSATFGFGIKARWLFSAGWGAAIMLSGLLGAFHLPGPRAATKNWRFLFRCLIVTPIMVGMPFSDLVAFSYVLVHFVVLAVIGIVEYIFVQMDKMGFFRSEATLYSSSTDGVEKVAINFGDERDDDDESDELEDTDDDNELKKNAAQGPDGAQGADIEANEPATDSAEATNVQDEEAQNVLRARLCKSHRKRLVAASKKRCKLECNA